jgi:hypothetical protein
MIRGDVFNRVATVQLENGDEYALFSNGEKEQDGNYNFLVVRPDGNIYHGGGLGCLMQVYKGIQAQLDGFRLEDEVEVTYGDVESLVLYGRPAKQSSLIHSFWYDRPNQRLWIQFVSGAGYMYPDVPEPYFHLLRKAKSAGKFFVDNIKHHFEGERIR